jgi:hypothetical protein
VGSQKKSKQRVPRNSKATQSNLLEVNAKKETPLCRLIVNDGRRSIPNVDLEKRRTRSWVRVTTLSQQRRGRTQRRKSQPALNAINKKEKNC